MHLLLATSWLDPIVNFMASIVLAIDGVVHQLGWTLVILAGLIRLAFWPLNTAQFKAMIGMQKIAPQLKAMQERYKDQPQKLNEATMTLYKESGVNPLAGCWPMLAQYPVIMSVYWVVLNHRTLYENTHFAWIGTGLATKWPNIFAANLAQPDLLLIVLYALSMYLSVRYVSMPATDPQQAQTQKMMAIVSPLMLGFLGFKYHWPSAMVLYWFAYNVFTMAQQLFMLRRYHQPLSAVDSEHAITEGVTAGASSNAKASLNGSTNGSVKSKKKNKKGA